MVVVSCLTNFELDSLLQFLGLYYFSDKLKASVN